MLEGAARPYKGLKVPNGSLGTVDLGLEGAARGAARCSKAGQQGGHGPARVG